MTPAQFHYQCTARFRDRSLPRAKRPTALHLKVAYWLSRWNSDTPKHAQLARAAGCCPRTVERALARFNDLGLLSWERRVLCCNGWRAQVANRYRFDACLKTYQRLYSAAKLSAPGERLAAAQLPLAIGGEDLLARRRQQWPALQAKASASRASATSGTIRK